MYIFKHKYGFQKPNVGFESRPTFGYLNPNAGSHIYCFSTHIYCFSAHIYTFKFMSIFWKLYKTHICVSKPTCVFKINMCVLKYTFTFRESGFWNPGFKARIWFFRSVNVGFTTQMWVLKPKCGFQNPDCKTNPTDVTVSLLTRRLVVLFSPVRSSYFFVCFVKVLFFVVKSSC